MNDFESRGQIEGDVMNLYNKIYLDDEPIIGTALVMYSFAGEQKFFFLF